jgi:hypothetical protein
MKHKSLLQWYSDLARAKKHGHWRFPLVACVAIFILVSPVIWVVLASVTIGVCVVMVRISVPMILPVMVACWIATACILAQLIYFALRVSCPEDDGISCRTCGYNLTGNVSGICPECGNPCRAEAGVR